MAPGSFARARRRALSVVLFAALIVPLLPVDPALAATFTVTTNADSGPGSLRQAILDANVDTTADVIDFNIAGSTTITPTTALPAITRPVTIDASTQPGYVGVPLVVLDGSSIASGATGFDIQHSIGDVTIQGFRIVRWSGTAGDTGIKVFSSGPLTTHIYGNYIGTDGSAAQPNETGIQATANNVTIGGSGTNQGNVISGNTDTGIRLAGAGAVIQGNLIGTNAAGTATLGNTSYGINLSNSDGALVGGPNPGEGNVISGNGRGIHVSGPLATNNTIAGNHIGTDAAGVLDLGNGTDGVVLNLAGTGNVIGGTSGNGNVISGNGTNGIFILATSGTEIRGNEIGVDGAATAAIPNLNGVSMQAGNFTNQHTNDTVIRGNTISGNTVDGIILANGTGIDSNATTLDRTVIRTNAIGVGAGGIDLGNGGYGIRLRTNAGDGTANDSMIGGGELGNEIAHNGNSGIRIEDRNFGNTISENSIHDNGGLEIDLNGDGRTGNDLPLDGDTGANDLQNFPVITGSDAGVDEVDVFMDSLANTTFTIEVFSAPSCSAVGQADAVTFLGSGTVTTDGGGTVSDTLALANFTPGDYLTATATSPDGDTSELADCVLVGTSASADLEVASLVESFTEPLESGADATYTVTYRNNGPDPANAVAVTVTADPGWTFSATGSSASCSANGPGSALCSLGTVPDASGDLTVTVVFETAGAAGSYDVDALISSAVTDPIPGNDDASVSTALVETSADLSVDLSQVMAGTIYAGDDVTYELSVDNAGPGTATGVEATLTFPAGGAVAGPLPAACSETTATTVTCSIASLAPADPVAPFDVTLTTTTTPGSFDVDAAVTGDQTDPTPGNDTDAVATTLTDPNPGFDPATRVALSGGASFVATGRFDADVHLDLAVTNPDDSAVSILLGDGSGGVAPATPPTITVGGNPEQIVAGRFDADAYLDLIVNVEDCTTGGNGCGSLVFLAGNGDGTFGAPVTIDVDDHPEGMTAADFNDDGDLDLAVANSRTGTGNPSDFSILLGNGDGTFAVSQVGDGGGNFGIDHADVNGDGNIDVVLAAGDEVTAYRGKGDGTFEDAQVTNVGSVASDPPQPVVADFDKDGYEDVAVNGSVHVLFGKGDGTFRATQLHLRTDEAHVAVVAADLNGDGSPDIVAARKNPPQGQAALRAFLGKGNGTFDPGDDAVVRYPATKSLAKGDLNDDGTPDLIVPNDTESKLTILLGNSVPSITEVDLEVIGPNSAPAGYAEVDVTDVDLGTLELGEGELEAAGGPEAAPTKRQPTKRQPTKRQPTKRQGTSLELPSVLQGATLGDLVAHQLGDRYTPLLTEIVPDGGWRPYLPITLQSTPLQEITLDDVIALPAVQDIPIDEIRLPTSLELLPPGAWLFGETPLSDVLPAGTTIGQVLADMGQECDPSGLTGSSTLVDVALRRCPLDAIPWDDVHLVDVQLQTSLLYHFNFSGIDPSKIAYTIGGSPQVMEDLTVASLPSGIVKPTCPSPCVTLADVEAKATRYDYETDATFGKLLDAANAGSLLGDMTLRQLLPGIVEPANFPFELVDSADLINAIRPPSAGAITYRASAMLACVSGSTEDVDLAVDLPNTLFRYVRNSAVATLGGDPISVGNPSRNGVTLAFSVPPNPCTGPTTSLVISFDVQPAPNTGVFTSSISASSGATTVREIEAAPVTLTEANSPNGDPDTAPELLPDKLYFGQLSSRTDVNYYRVPVDNGDVGKLMISTLSNATADVDLVLYGSPEASQSLRASGIADAGIGANGLGDQEGCLPAGYVLEAQTLQDVPQLPPEDAAIRGFSSNRSTYAEVVCSVVQEADADAGFLTLQVSSFDGPFEQPHVLRYTFDQQIASASCLAPSLPFSGSTVDPMPSNAAVQGATTYFLINEERLASMYGQQALLDLLDGTAATNGKGLRDLAADEDGVIIPVELDPAVGAGYDALDGDAACSPERQNEIVRAINALVDSKRGSTQPEHVVIVGSDALIPFARVQDLTTLGNQISYAAELRVDGEDTPVSRAFARGFVLTDDAYVGYSPIPWVGNPVYLPASAIGRLVETPTEMLEQVDAFYDSNGILAPDTALVSGADFSRDVARQIATTFEGVLDQNDDPVFDVNRKLAPEPNALSDWSKNDMLCQLKGQPAAALCSGQQPFGVPGTANEPGLISVNGHFNHFATETGDNGLLTTEEFSSVTLPRGTLLFTIGCNSGVPVDDGYNAGASDAPEPLDWPQALARKNGVLVANTGYGYGDTNTIAFSERLMLGFSEQMFTRGLDGQNISIGEALAYSKTLMFSGLGVYTPYDIKSIEEATLYGLPMYRMGNQAQAGGANATPPSEDADTGLEASQLTVNGFVVDPRDRRSTPRGDYFVGGPAGTVTSVPGYPVQPLSQPYDMTVDGTSLHDALVTDLTVDLGLEGAVTDPVYSTALLDGGVKFAEDPLVSDVVFPTGFTNATSSETVFGRRDFLVLFGGRFASNPLAFLTGTGTQRIYNDMSVRAYYSTSSDRTRPTVSSVQGADLGTVASFTVTSPSPDVAAAYVTYRRQPNAGADTGTFQTVRLGSVGGGTFRGSVSQSPRPIVEYFIQLVDTSGNVGVWQPRSAQGALPPATPPPSGVNVVVNGNQVNGWYDGPVTVSLSGGFQTFQYSVDGGPLSTYSSPVAVPAGGQLDGVHTFAWSGSYGASNVEYIPIDGAPPTISTFIEDPKHVGGETWIGPDARVLVTVSDTGSGVGQCSIELTGPAPATIPCEDGQTPVSFSGRSDGRYTITVDAADNVGGTGHTASATVELILDTQAPALGFGVHDGPTYVDLAVRRYVRSDTTLRATVEDEDVAPGVPGSGVQSCAIEVLRGGVSVGDPTCSAGQRNQDFSIDPPASFPDGAYDAETSARDHVTNASARSDRVYLDNTEPAVTTIVESGPEHVDGSGRRYITSATVVRVTANDPAAPDDTPGSGVDPTTCTIGLRETADGTSRNRACVEGTTDVSLAPGEPDGPPGSSPTDPTFDDGEYTIDTSAPDHVTNEGTDSLAVALDNTAPVFGDCPTPVPGVSGRLVSNISSSATSFVVDELATSPRVPFDITIDGETMRVTRKVLVKNTTTRFTYTVTRGIGGTTAAPHGANAGISWTLEVRRDLLGRVVAGVDAGATTIQVAEERFGVPAMPFVVSIGGEDLRVVERDLASGSTYDWTVVRGVRGTSPTTIDPNAEARWGDVWAAVYFNSAEQTLTIGAADPALTDGVPGSGLAPAASTLVRSLPTDQIGTFVLGYEAKDKLGNTRTKTCTYEVIYMFSGFYAPVDPFKVNTASPGQGVAVKWRITDAHASPITTDDSFRSVTASNPITGGCGLTPSFAVLSETFKGGSNLQNLGGGNFQFNWAIPKDYKGSCRTMAVRLFGPGLMPDAPPAGFAPSRRYQFANFQIKAK